MRASLLPEGPLSFADYFKLNAEIEDVLACFGFSFAVKRCDLPRQEVDATRLEVTRERLEEGLLRVSLTSEAARREFLIAPVLLEAAHFTNAKIKVEYPIDVGPQLRGSVDFLLRTKHNVVVVEAKNADLQRGFTQLAVELIALDQWLGDQDRGPLLHGAVSIGNAWQFGILDRENKCFTQDVHLYRVPDDFEDLVRILVALLKKTAGIPVTKSGHTGKTYLVTWNPMLFDEEEITRRMREIADSGSALLKWSLGNRRHVSPGDRVFLLRQKVEPCGLIGSGEIVGEVEVVPHWVKSKREKGMDSRLAPIRWDRLSTTPFVTREELIRQTGEKKLWSTQSGGVTIRPDLAAVLETLWSSPR